MDIILMKYEIDLQKELVDFFNDIFTLFDTDFTNRETMLKHILLEGIEHRLEHIAHNQIVDQHT
jgi:hypothetical protein